MRRRVIITIPEIQQGVETLDLSEPSRLELEAKMYYHLGRWGPTACAHKWKHWPMFRKDGSSVGEPFKLK